MCTAVNFSNRVLYAILTRLIVSFRITQSPTMPPNTDFIRYKRDPTAANALASDFKATFVPRDWSVLKQCLERSQVHSRDFSNDSAEILIR